MFEVAVWHLRFLVWGACPAARRDKIWPTKSELPEMTGAPDVFVNLM